MSNFPMISKEPEQPCLLRSEKRTADAKSAVRENTIELITVQIERKNFQFALKENRLGRFLRITEEVGGRWNSIIVPAAGLGDFTRVLDQIRKSTGEGLDCSVEQQFKSPEPTSTADHPESLGRP